KITGHHGWRWILLLVIALPLLPKVGTVTTNSATNLPSSAPSAQAANEIAQQFPNETAPSASFILLVGPDISGPAGQNATVAVTQRIESDPNLTYVHGVSSLYSAYGSYLGGMAEIANGAILQGSTGPGSAPVAVNQSAAYLWGPPSTFVADWQAYVAAHTGNPSSANFPAYNETLAALGGSLPEIAVLNAFYTGPGLGFNASADCAAAPAAVVACADRAARAGEILLLPNASAGPAAELNLLVLSTLGVENSTSWPSVRFTASVIIGEGAGLLPSWTNAVWAAWPASGPTPTAAVSWGRNLANTTPVARYPLAIPLSLREQFLSTDGTATLIVVAYSIADGYTTPSGATPIYSDVLELDRIVPSTLASAGAGGSIQYFQTGGAALDQNEAVDLSSSLAIVLPLTLLVLVLITIAYFRAPLTPLITFGALGLALGLATAGIVVVGTLLAHVDVTAVELVTTFVLGVGTDYAIFLVAR
ncbi:MAG: MMPL family transporter, partial [Candidatus Lutacidiplasmatales archaeon]